MELTIQPHRSNMELNFKNSKDVLDLKLQFEFESICTSYKILIGISFEGRFLRYIFQIGC